MRLLLPLQQLLLLLLLRLMLLLALLVRRMLLQLQLRLTLTPRQLPRLTTTTATRKLQYVSTYFSTTVCFDVLFHCAVLIHV